MESSLPRGVMYLGENTVPCYINPQWANDPVRTFRQAPLVMGCADNSFSIDGQFIHFPPVPFFVPYLVKYIFASKYSGAWKFAPCDMFGRPRKLAFSNPKI